MRQFLGTPLRIVIADDAPLIRRGLATVLSAAGAQVLAEATDAPGLLRSVDGLLPDLVVTDIRMPPGNGVDGLAAAVTIQQRHPRTGIILLSNHAETRHLQTLLDRASAGVGYLLKERVIDTEDFIAAVTRVAAGGTAMDPEIVALLLSRRRQGGHLATLTPRERDVLVVMATGASNSAIASSLHISLKTVETHIPQIFAKLDLHEDPDGNRRVRAVLAYMNAT